MKVPAGWVFVPLLPAAPPLPLQEGKAAIGRTTSGSGPSRQAWLNPAGEALQELSRLNPEDRRRIELPADELNRVLGGGIVAGSVALLAGEPGVGKSTLLLQLARFMSEGGHTVAYLSGEESPHQIKLRSETVGLCRRPGLSGCGDRR